MKVFFTVLAIQLVGFCLLGAPLLAAPQKDGVEKWIHDLASESYQVREKASQELWKMGDTALPALREAVLSKDPEVALRAREAVEKVELRISVDTPERILSLIEAYQKAPSRQKMNLLNALKEENALYQLLKLYSMEEEKEQAELAVTVQGVAVTAAREAIVKDDVELAIELLSIAPPKHSELMALACLYRSLGQLDQQLTASDPPPNVKLDVWKGYLLRAKGDLDAAVVHAEEMNQLQLLAGLKVLQGDPIMWLERNNSPGHRTQRAHASYVKIALKRWRGEEIEKNDYDPLLRLLKGNSRLQRNQGMISLASLGKYEWVEKVQTKENILFGYLYYLSREEGDKALGALGLDPKNPDYNGWVQKQFDEINNGNESDMIITQLMILAGFMEKRGLEKELEEAYSPHLAELQKQGLGAFLNFITRFIDSSLGAPHFALEQVTNWAGEDEERWGEIFSAVLGEEDTAMEWLVWIREVDPEMKDREALEVMLALLHRSSSPGDLREKWMHRLWQEVENEKDKDKKTKYVRQIMSLCISQQDVLNTLKAWDMLDKDERAAASWGSIDIYLSAAGRWKEAAEILLSMREGKTFVSPEVHAHLAATLRRGGMEERAREHEALADKLALGSATSSMRIGGYYVYAGDFERADIWFRRAAIESEPSDGEFLKALEKCAEKYVRSRNWKLAASCHEVIMHISASQSHRNGSLSDLTKSRMSADLARAMMILPEDKERALKTLKTIHQDFKPDGVLADDFFPALREAGLNQELEEWFAESWKLMVGVIDEFPKSHNSRNTAAWFASRAGFKLAEAEKYLTEAIKMSPEQAAYLDTMAELKFAQGDRKAALKWSQRSVCFAPFEDMIRLQHERFRTAPLPKN